VPGNNERMLRKALSKDLECDCIIFDLEDAVPLDQKEQARKLILKILSESSDLKTNRNKKELFVRINQLDNPISKLDIASFAKEDSISSFVVPKAVPQSIKTLLRKSGKHIIPIIESAAGFLRVEEIARSKGIDSLAYGAADMALSMRGSVETYQGIDYIRTKLAIVARSYDINPIDQVYFDLNNIDGFRNEARRAKDLGYAGKLLIHPNQIEIANEVFSNWSTKDKEWAKQVIDAYEESTKRGSKGALRLNGQLIDAVHYKLAKDILGASD
jgi:citrate lyase subunit beta / citryl-CoA lyase